MLPAAQRSRPATHIVVIPGGLCLSSARGGGSSHSPRAPTARKDGSAIFVPGWRDRSSPRLRRSRPGGGVLLATRAIHRPTVTLGIYQRPYIPVHERPLVLHAEACASVTVRNNGAPGPIALRGQRSSTAVSFFPHGVMSSLTGETYRVLAAAKAEPDTRRVMLPVTPSRHLPSPDYAPTDSRQHIFTNRTNIQELPETKYIYAHIAAQDSSGPPSIKPCILER